MKNQLETSVMMMNEKCMNGVEFLVRDNEFTGKTINTVAKENQNIMLPHRDLNQYHSFKPCELGTIPSNLPVLTFHYQKGDRKLALIQEIVEYLSYPSRVQVKFNEKEILIAEFFDTNDRYFRVDYLSGEASYEGSNNPLRRQAVIYSNDLVIGILDMIGINRNVGGETSFGLLRYEKINHKPCAVISINI